MTDTIPSKPFEEMSNGEKLTALKEQENTISVFKKQLAMYEVDLAEMRAERDESEAKFTRLSRVIHANACLHAGQSFITHGLTADLSDAEIAENMTACVDVGMALGEAITDRMAVEPDTADDLLASDEDPGE